MPNVTVTRKPVSLPPVSGVTIELTGAEAVRLAALLGQFGSEFPYTSALFLRLADLLVVRGNDVDLTKTYEETVREATAAITYRAQTIARQSRV